MTGEMLYRGFQPDLEVRSGGDGRTIHGIVVPYGAPTRINHDLIEEFVPGFNRHQHDNPRSVKLSRDHISLGGTLIGAGAMMRDDAAGLYMELRASRTPIGDETIELVKDGAIDELSVGFSEIENERAAGGVVRRKRAHVSEVAVVMQGAYGRNAVVNGVRSAGATHDMALVGARLTSDDIDLRSAAAKYLAPGALPDLDDWETRARAIRLGLIY